MITIPMDKAGRLVLPKEIRAKLHLEAGDLLEAEVGVNEVRLRPRHAAQCGISREGGRVVWDAPGASATVEQIDRASARGRVERDARAAGM
jgi:AbrB family looped-hinge helix DNA binding protein